MLVYFRLYWGQLAHQWLLLPHSVDFLILPIPRLVTQLYVEMEDHADKEHSHFMPSKVLVDRLGIGRSRSVAALVETHLSQAVSWAQLERLTDAKLAPDSQGC